jgi:nucleoid-associated protein
MNIRNIIVHEVRKEDGDEKAEILPRHEENEINEHANTLSTELSQLFRKTGLNTGGFLELESEDDPLPHFVGLLTNYFNGEAFSEFANFSNSAAKEFKRKLDESGSSKGGYLWFNHYINNSEHFLSVVLLRKKAGLSISADLTLDEIERIDLDKLHMAARINLTSWLEGSSSRYIAFRIGRDAKDVTSYFSKFIGCQEYTRAKVDTQQLVQVVRKYCAQHGFGEVKSEGVKQFVYEQCLDWLAEEIPVSIDALSVLLDGKFQPSQQNLFLEIAQGDPFFLNNEIPIEKSALRGLTRYSGKNKKMALSFDSDLLNVSVFYNDGNKSLLFTELPDKLIYQMQDKITEAV